MATTAKDSVRRLVAGRKSIFMSAKSVIDSTVTFNQGDLLAFDTSAKLLKAIALSTDSQTFVGMAPVSISSGKLVSPYQGTAVDAAQAIGDIPGPIYGDIHEVKLKSGDVFNPGDKVYAAYASDAQTVTSTSDGYAIGIYQGATVTAGSSSTGEVLIGCRYALGNPVL